MINVSTATVAAVTAALIGVAGGCSREQGAPGTAGRAVSGDELTRALVGSLEVASSKGDVRLAARTIIAMALFAEGNETVEDALSDAWRRFSDEPLPKGIDWPDRMAEQMPRREAIARGEWSSQRWGRRNVTLSFLLLEARQRISERTGYVFGGESRLTPIPSSPQPGSASARRSPRKAGLAVVASPGCHLPSTILPQRNTLMATITRGLGHE